MQYLFRLFWVCMLFFSINGLLPAQNTHSQRLHQLIDEDWDFRMKMDPAWATTLGEVVKDLISPMNSIEKEYKKAAFWRNIIDQLDYVSLDSLEKKDQINYKIFRFILENDVRQIAMETYLIPIQSDGGFHIDYIYMANGYQFNKLEDYSKYISRLKEFKKIATDNIAVMQIGLEKGITMPQIVLENYEASIDVHVVNDPEESFFYKAFKNMPADMDESAKEELQAAAKQAIEQSIIPGYKMFSDFIKNEYRPNARKTLGASQLPNGKSYYQQQVDYYTTLDLTADEVHQIGITEVSRIRSQMEAIVKEVEFDGSFEDFIKFLRTDPQFYCDTPECLLKEAAYLSKKIDGLLPNAFKKLPRLPYGVEPVPDAIAPKYTGGRYIEGSAANFKSGTYWVNTYDLKSRPLYVLPALTLHEAVPGHHLQISLAAEIKDLPKFRQHTYLSCYGEGWALYCEFLGEELGMYTTPYERFGRLTYEMWRACRLVVDTGIHSKGWSREKALDYLASNTALSMHECNTEIDRYIGWPGQALSYKIGELKIKELRTKAKEKLGDKFDLRAFHDLILSQGSVPLFILEELVDDWIMNF
jgi:uncharacterized protein (DUF885 family)